MTYFCMSAEETGVEETLVRGALVGKAKQEATARVYDCGLENHYLCVAVVHWFIFMN